MILQFWNSMGKRLQSRTAVLAVGAAVCVGASLLAIMPAQAERRDGKDDTAYVVKRVYKTGDADRYKIVVKMNMEIPTGPIEMLETMIMKETTKEAKADGSSTVIFDFESMLVTANGMDLDMTSMLPKITTTIGTDGKTDVKVEGGNEQLIAQMGDQVKKFTNSATAFVPKKPVKVGDSWDVDAANFGAPGQNVKGKSTLVAVDVVKGVKVGKIKSVMDITDAMNTKLHSETTSYINIETGKAQSSTSKTDGDTAGGKFSMEMTTKMLDPGDKGDSKEPIKN